MNEEPSDDQDEVERAEDANDEESRHAAASSRLSRFGTPPPLEIPAADGTPKGQFLHDLYTFMQKIGQPIAKVPQLGYQELDLYKLYQIVIKRGGMDEVTKRQEWKAVYQELGIPTMSTSASYNTRTNYKKHLYLYELEHCDFNDRRPPGMEPKFDIGDYVRIVSSNYEGQVFYARIVKCRWRNGRNNYYVHYNGWSNSHDEWMPEAVLSSLLPEESEAPESLANPHPNRSSKSNHIIGDPAPHHTPRETRGVIRRRPAKSLPSEGEDTSTEESASDSSPAAYVPRGTARAAKEEGRRRVQVRLRHRDRSGQESSATTTTSASPAAGSTVGGVTPSANFLHLQREMDKLEADRFLEYTPPRRPKLLREDNVHRYSPTRSVVPFKTRLLEMVDLRVPRLEDLVQSPPAETTGPVLSSRQGAVGHNKGIEMPEKTDGMRALEQELQSIRREYRRKKRLLQLYYGSSESGSSGDSYKSPPPPPPPHHHPGASSPELTARPLRKLKKPRI